MIQFAICENLDCGQEFWRVIDKTEKKVLNYLKREGFNSRCICPDCANELTIEEIKAIRGLNSSRNK